MFKACYPGVSSGTAHGAGRGSDAFTWALVQLCAHGFETETTEDRSGRNKENTNGHGWEPHALQVPHPAGLRAKVGRPGWQQDQAPVSLRPVLRATGRTPRCDITKMKQSRTPALGQVLC